MNKVNTSGVVKSVDQRWPLQMQYKQKMHLWKVYHFSAIELWWESVSHIVQLNAWTIDTNVK